MVNGGIHTKLGNPVPGRKKTFECKWTTMGGGMPQTHAPVELFTCGDYETVSIHSPNGRPIRVILAKWGVKKEAARFFDYTREVQALVNAQGGLQLVVNGGIHTKLGNPVSGRKKTFEVQWTTM